MMWNAIGQHNGDEVGAPDGRIKTMPALARESLAANGAGRTIQSVDRATAMLQLLGEQGDSLALNDFVQAVGVHKSTAHRLLAALQDAGLVGRDPATGRYQLGLELVALSGVVLGRLEVLRIADPHLRRLADQTQETVNLGIRHQDDILNIEQIPGPRLLRSFDWLGKRSPLHRGAAATALLAHLPDDEIAAYLAGANARGAELEPAALWENVEEIRRRGVAINRGELDPEVVAVGAPIFTTTGRASASISIAGRRQDLPEARLAELADCVIETAQVVSRQFGAPTPRLARMA